MDIFVYSDESGVFDVLHNDWFTFGGLIFLSKQSRNDAARQYIHAERCLSLPDSFDRALELKAANLDNKSKYGKYIPIAIGGGIVLVPVAFAIHKYLK